MFAPGAVDKRSVFNCGRNELEVLSNLVRRRCLVSSLLPVFDLVFMPKSIIWCSRSGCRVLRGTLRPKRGQVLGDEAIETN